MCALALRIAQPRMVERQGIEPASPASGLMSLAPLSQPVCH